MPVIQVETTIAAGAVNPNLFAGSAFEYLRRNSLVSVGVTAAATGTFATFTSGADLIAEEFAPAVLTRYPVIPDEMYYSDVGVQGDRLVLRVRNPTGGGVIHRAIAQITEY